MDGNGPGKPTNGVTLCIKSTAAGFHTACAIQWTFHGIGSLQGSEHADKYRCDTKHLGSMITVAGKIGVLRCFSQ